VLRNIEEEHEGHIYAFWWFSVYHNMLDNFGEILALNDVVVNNED
jgi:hypothetical protein